MGLWESKKVLGIQLHLDDALGRPRCVAVTCSVNSGDLFPEPKILSRKGCSGRSPGLRPQAGRANLCVGLGKV